MKKFFLIGVFLFLVFLYKPFFLFASETVGSIDASFHIARLLCDTAICGVGGVNDSAKVNFKPDTTLSGTAPVAITDSGLTGYFWGSMFGWANLSPTCGGLSPLTCGVKIDPATGILRGNAWVNNSHWINFGPFVNPSSPVVQVTINSSGELNGYAWYAGGNGGWIKFDCSTSAACVKTDWRPISARVTTDDHQDNGSGCLTNCGSNDTTDNTVVDNIDHNTNNNTDNNNNVNNTSVGNSAGNVISGVITRSISNVVNNPAVTQKAEKTYVAVKKTVYKPKVSIALKIVSVAGIVSGTLATALFLNPITLWEMLFIPVRLWSFLLVALGIRKRRKPWGTVYDSITKQPIDPAYVVLLDMMGNEIATSITDLDGRYGFLAPAGVYKIVASKTNYKFPSDKLKGKNEDELYIDLYKGDNVTITKEGEVITKNIPLDPEKFDWNEFAKNQQSLMKFSRKRDFILDRIASATFNIGFLVSAVAVFMLPTTYNKVVIGIYAGLGIIRRIAPRAKTRGSMLMSDGTPISYGILRIFSPETNQEIAHKVADAKGNFYALIQNGKYYVTIEQKNADESYTKIFTSDPFEVKKGILKKKFVVGNQPLIPLQSIQVSTEPISSMSATPHPHS